MKDTVQVHPVPATSPPRAVQNGKWTGLATWTPLLLIAITFVAMTVWSWGKWLDPLVDSSREIYVPWQLAEGKVLYRDIAYFNGPLSPYVNALWFDLLGVSLRTLVACNLVILLLITAMLYGLFSLITGRVCALIVALTFLLMLGFGHLMAPNYNYVFPYSHETTHGTALALAMLLLLGRFMRRGSAWDLGLAGAVLGLIFLTKVEIFVAAVPAALTAVGLQAWGQRRGPKSMGADLMTLLIPSLAAPLITWGLLSLTMPGKAAVLGILGSCRFALNTKLSTLLYFQVGSGLFNPADSVLKLLLSLLYFAAFLVPVSMAAWLAGWAGLSAVQRTIVAAAVFALVAAVLGVRLHHIPWLDVLRAIPLFVGFLGAAALMRWRRVREQAGARNQAALLLVMVVFALALLPKIFLYVRVFHYGFFLAMPATMLMVAGAVQYLPDWLARHGGSATVFRGGAAAVLLMTVLWHLQAAQESFAKQTVTVGTGADQFYADDRGHFVNQAVHLLSEHLGPDETVAVLPEGAMINYLARRVNPTPYIIFMPSDLIMFGEDRVLAAFVAHPPEYIVLVHKDTWIYGSRFFGQDYATGLMRWIKEHYLLVEKLGAEPFKGDQFGMVILRNPSVRPSK